MNNIDPFLLTSNDITQHIQAELDVIHLLGSHPHPNVQHGCTELCHIYTQYGSGPLALLSHATPIITQQVPKLLKKTTTFLQTPEGKATVDLIQSKPAQNLTKHLYNKHQSKNQHQN